MALEELLFYREKQHRVQVKAHTVILCLYVSDKVVIPGFCSLDILGRVCARGTGGAQCWVVELRISDS